MQKKITMSKYNDIMSSIIKKGKPVVNTLIDMLEEASKYEIKPILKARKRNARRLQYNKGTKKRKLS